MKSVEHFTSKGKEGQFLIDFQTREPGSILKYIFGVSRKHLNDIRTNPFCFLFHEFCAQTSISNGFRET